MLGTLSLMACTLLLAAVPSLSSSLQPREEVNLPAIGYVMDNGVRYGIEPLAADTSVDMNFDWELTADVYFGGSSLQLTSHMVSDTNFATVCYEDANGELTFDGAYDALESAEIDAYVYIYGSSAGSIDVYLPDLSYWVASDDGFHYICLIVNVATGHDGYAVYGNSAVYNSVSQSYALTYSTVELGEDVNPVGAIGDGLGVIGALGGALSSGFDGVFLDNGALTAVGTFSFVLLGLGISVGIVKKCFNWVTGRHGM